MASKIANECPRCKVDFSSLTAFDNHQVGDIQRDWSLDYDEGFRCLGVGEFEDYGMELVTQEGHRDFGRWRMRLTDERRASLEALSTS